MSTCLYNASSLVELVLLFGHAHEKNVFHEQSSHKQSQLNKITCIFEIKDGSVKGKLLTNDDQHILSRNVFNYFIFYGN